METILFLIIAGILSSIFGKAKGKSKQGRIKPFTAKGFNDLRTRVEQSTGKFTTGKPANEDTPIQSIEEKYQEIKQKPVVARSQASQVATRIEVEPENDLFEKPDDKDIINGIIWAEILGKPRAKNPYFSKK